MTDGFAHLHVHTEFSMLDGASKVKELAGEVARDGMTACGITDHGNMYGVLDFYKACQEQGIKPVIGTELYQAYEHRNERLARKKGVEDDSGGEDEKGRKNYYHITALAENQVGYKNLIQLSSRSYLEGYYMKPRVDWELLSQHSEGMIVTSGCLGGQVLQHMMRGEDKEALLKASLFQDIFGKDNFFVEIQDHGIPDQHKTNPKLMRLAKKLGAPLVATNDSHYTAQHDHVAHDALLCVQTGSFMSDPNRFKFHGDQHYVKTAAEMRELFSEVPEACDNTLLIAERCNVEIELGVAPILPNFTVPEKFSDENHYLRVLAMNGAKKRWGDPLPEHIAERMAYELKIIEDMGFASYFLIVWDLMRHARERQIRVGPGRGSAAGSAVSYALHITDLDPIQYDLLFERFLNPSRVSMPDIDMDFDSRYREEMIRYSAEKYGQDHVAQIITFSTIKARAAVRDAARVLEMPYEVGDRLAKAMPPLISGRTTPLAACFELDPEYEEGYALASDLRDMYEADDDNRKTIDTARGLEGLRRQDGIHAAAVVITKDPLTEYLPVQRKPLKNTRVPGPVVTQYEMHGVDELGLLKMDFLGLTNLDVIEDTVNLIEKTQGTTLFMDEIPLDDEKTFTLLQEADTVGVFQLEGAQMRNLLKSLRPTNLDDIAACIALYRPGPMADNMHNDYADRKNGRKPVAYAHPDAKECLEETYGLMIYQESLMRVAEQFAGYTLAQADNLRKACGKKIREVMAAEEKKFIQGCIDTGYGAEVGEMWFAKIKPFADYAFAKAHAYGYGLISYQTAYLKANYPIEYMCSLMSNSGSVERTAVYLYDCHTRGIEVKVPDINKSNVGFIPDGDSILFGMAHVANVGVGAVEHIVKAREVGAYKDFFDFCDRVDPSVLNKKFVESLIKAGAFDSMDVSRHGLMAICEETMASTVKRRKKEADGQFDLFSAMEGEVQVNAEIPTSEYDKKRKLTLEKEVLGFYVSDTPISGIQHIIDRKTTHAIAQVKDSDEGDINNEVHMGGMITQLQKRYTKKGDLMATFILEDTTSSIKVWVFPKTMKHSGHYLKEDAVAIVRGRPDYKDEDVRFFASEVRTMENVSEHTTEIHLKWDGDDAKMQDIRGVLQGNPGNSTVYLHVDGQVLKLNEDFQVKCSPEFLSDIELALA